KNRECRKDVKQRAQALLRLVKCSERLIDEVVRKRVRRIQFLPYFPQRTNGPLRLARLRTHNHFPSPPIRAKDKRPYRLLKRLKIKVLYNTDDSPLDVLELKRLSHRVFYIHTHRFEGAFIDNEIRTVSGKIPEPPAVDKRNAEDIHKIFIDRQVAEQRLSFRILAFPNYINSSVREIGWKVRYDSKL